MFIELTTTISNRTMHVNVFHLTAFSVVDGKTYVSHSDVGESYTVVETPEEITKKVKAAVCDIGFFLMRSFAT